MAESSKLLSLEESLKFAKDAYVKASKVAGDHGEKMPMTLDAWLHQARERHAVLSNMDDDQRELALEEARQEQMPALLATRDFLDQMLSAIDPGRGGTQAKGRQFATKIVKGVHKVNREARRAMRKKRG